MSDIIKGTIKNERLGIEAPFERQALRSGREDYIFGRFEGHSKTNLFTREDGWTFEEAKPSLYDDVEGLNAGTIFTISRNETATYLRVHGGYRSIHTNGTSELKSIPTLWRAFYDYTVTPIHVPEY